MNSDPVPFSWFDILVLMVMLAGFVRGRKRGLSGELLSLMKWLAVIVLGNLYYEPLGDWLADHAQVTHNYANICVYVTIILGVWLAGALVKQTTRGKLIRKDSFGRLEKPLGMIAGATRYLCGIFIGIVILNTVVYKPKEIAGPVARLQQQIVYNSATGLFVREHLSMTLIEPVPDTPAAATTSVAQQRQQEVNDAMQGR